MYNNRVGGYVNVISVGQYEKWKGVTLMYSTRDIGAVTFPTLFFAPVITMPSKLWHTYMGQVTKLWLSCYLVLLSIDSKTR